jgi:ubiquinone/menaquinone biosynthesis C-methylase UbiE
VADAAKLPWEAQTFDLALSFMSLHDTDDMTAAVPGIARACSSPGRKVLPGDRASAHPCATESAILAGPNVD